MLLLNLVSVFGRRAMTCAATLATAAVLCIGSATPSQGAVIFTGLQDLHDWINGTGRHDPYPPKYGVDRYFFGYSTAPISTRTDLAGDLDLGVRVDIGSYLFVDAAPHPQLATGEVLLTSVLGRDLDPDEGALLLGGFDAVTPRIGPAGPQIINGADGILYESQPAERVLLGDLAAELPGHDLLGFSDTHPGEMFYVFRTVMPLSALGVPEPNAALLALAGVSAGMFWRRS